MQNTYTYDSDGVGQGTDPLASVKIRNVVIGYYKQIGTVTVEFDARDTGWSGGAANWDVKFMESDVVKSTTSFAVKTTWKRYSAKWQAGKIASDNTCKNLQNLGDTTIKVRIEDEDDTATDFTKIIPLDLDPVEYDMAITSTAESIDATPDITWTLNDLESEQKMAPVLTVGSNTANSMVVTFEEAASPFTTSDGYINLNGVKFTDSYITLNAADAAIAYWVRASEYKITSPTMASGDNPYSIDLNCTTLVGTEPELTSFISTWETTGSNEKVTLPIVQNNKAGDANTINFTIDWGDGDTDTVTAWNDDLGGGAIDHTYSTADTYTITMTGTIQGLKFNNSGDDKTKIKTITNWGTFNISTESAFFGCSALNVTATDAPTVSSTSLKFTFRGCAALTSIGGDWDVSSVTDMTGMFYQATSFNQDIGDWDVSSVTIMTNIFYEAEIFNQDISSWDVGEVTIMNGMFQRCYVFNQDIGNWDVSSVTQMVVTFDSAYQFNQDISGWNTAAVATMYAMFQNASSFDTAIPTSDDNWNVSSVQNMNSMFLGSPFNQDLSTWDVSSVTNMAYMFYNVTEFNQDIGNWDVSSVTTMRSMFNRASSFNQDIGGWDVANVTLRYEMFYTATAFDQDISDWDIGKETNMYNFLGGGETTAPTLSTANYNKLLHYWHAQEPPDSINFGAPNCEADGSAGEVDGDTARAALVLATGSGGDGWSITDKDTP